MFKMLVLVLPVFIFGLSFITDGAVGELVDLTHAFHNNTIYWPGTKQFRLTHVFKGRNDPGGFWLELNEFEAAEHGGTHMDAPSHFAEGKWSMDKIPIDRFICPAVVVDVSGQAALNSDYKMTVEDLMDWEKKYGRIPDGSIVFLYSKWDERWPDKEQYLGNGNEDTSNLHFPGFSLAAVEWVTENRVIYGIGIDTPSPDCGQCFPNVHIHILGRNILILENVNNLGQLPPRGSTVMAFPMKIKGGSGSPCRLIAKISDKTDMYSGSSTISASFSIDSAILITAVWSF